MKGLANCASVVTWVALTVIAPAGCEGPEHRMVHPKPGTNIVCQQCYDEVNTERRTAPRLGTQYNVIVRTHMCPACGTEMSIYRESGVLMVKCARCAPAGLACDQCLPPNAPVK